MRPLLIAGALAATLWRVPLSAQTPPLTRFSSQKAESMLRDRLPCLGCHALHGEGGRIGPDLTTVRERRSQAYIAAMVANPQQVVPGSAMPRTALPEATRSLIVAYLSSLPADKPAPEAPAPAADAAALPAADGAALYDRWCVACHGAYGKGDGPNASALPVKPAQHASREAMEARSDDALYDTIAGGGAIMNRSPRMPAFGATLTDGEIRALVAQIRTLCGCKGPVWSRDGNKVTK
ncbi:MAG: cytochrome c [Gemmatimonadaceae bacterium]